MYQLNRILLNSDSEAGGGEVTVPTTPSYSPPTSMQHQALTSSPRANATSSDVAPPPEALVGTFDVSGLEDIQYPENKEATNSEDFSKDAKQGIEIKAAPDKKVEVKPEAKVELKTEEKKGLNAKLPDAPKVDTAAKEEVSNEKLKTVEKGTAEARDYSIFPEEIRESLKKTGNQAFEFVKDIYTKHKKTEEELTTVKKEVETIQKGGFPSQWFEHPEAWRLHPVSQQGIQKLDRLQFEENFFRDQLGKIKVGEKWQTIKGYNKGVPVYSELMEPSEDDATNIILGLGKLGAAKQNEALRLNNFAQTFSSNMQGLEVEVDKIIDQEFPWRKDDKHECQQFVKEFKDVTAGILPKSKSTDLAGYLYAALCKTKELLVEAQKTAKVEGIKQETKEKIEPSVKSPSVNGAPKSGVSNKKVDGTYTPPAKFDLAGMVD